MISFLCLIIDKDSFNSCLKVFPLSTPAYIVMLINVTVELPQLKTVMIVHQLYTNPNIKECECDCKPCSCPSLPHSILSYPILSVPIPCHPLYRYPNVHTHMRKRTFENSVCIIPTLNFYKNNCWRKNWLLNLYSKLGTLFENIFKLSNNGWQHPLSQANLW